MTLEESVRLQGWSMDDWHVVLAKQLGWSEPGLVIVAATVVCIVLYIVFFFALLQWSWECKERYVRSSGFVAFLWWWPAAITLTLFLFLHVIHTLLFVWFGYCALVEIREWWHKGAR